ncbi:hypothetical protein [Kribbella sp. NPDC003557]|uniref:hypothetical protein n=1 Tax=Kribbella sp. NPDC003557 TaxID=3154449 RepID=UPI0033B002AA
MKKTPSTVMHLPVGSSAAANDPIGTCTDCGVWACSMHATRYAAFQCAICLPAAAVVSAVTGSASSAANAAKSAPAANRSDLLITGRRVLQRIVGDMRHVGLTIAPAGRPNLITELTETLEAEMATNRQLTADERPVPSAADVGAAVSNRMGRLEPNPREDAPAIIVGAVAMAYHLAGEGDIAERANGLQQLQRPWLVETPLLLDPVLWMVAVATQEV